MPLREMRGYEAACVLNAMELKPATWFALDDGFILSTLWVPTSHCRREESPHPPILCLAEMGGLCGARNTSEFHIQFVVEYNRFVTLFSRLRLSQLEARKLYTFFRSIDVDGSGHITLDEFKTKVKCAPSSIACPAKGLTTKAI